MDLNGISVIIPMLNSEKYVETCIKSILRQGNAVKQIICVDNGSADQTVSIIEKLKAQSEGIELLHCEQQGVSAARNLGIQHAGGKYIMFVDSDDYLQKRKLGSLYKKAIKSDADILIFGGTSTEPLKTPYWVRKVLSPKKEEITLDACENIYEKRGVVPATWNKLYKRELIKKIGFSTELRIAEDKLFQFFAFSLAKRVKFVQTRIYVYRLSQDSVMNQTVKAEKAAQHTLAMQLAEEWLKDRKMLQEKGDALEAWKKTFEPMENVKGSVLQKATFYIRNFGMRSFVEIVLGQLMYKKKQNIREE